MFTHILHKCTILTYLEIQRDYLRLRWKTCKGIFLNNFISPCGEKERELWYTTNRCGILKIELRIWAGTIVEKGGGDGMSRLNHHTNTPTGPDRLNLPQRHALSYCLMLHNTTLCFMKRSSTKKSFIMNTK